MEIKVIAETLDSRIINIKKAVKDSILLKYSNHSAYCWMTVSNVKIGTECEKFRHLCSSYYKMFTRKFPFYQFFVTGFITVGFDVGDNYVTCNTDSNNYYYVYLTREKSEMKTNGLRYQEFYTVIVSFKDISSEHKQNECTDKLHITNCDNGNGKSALYCLSYGVLRCSKSEPKNVMSVPLMGCSNPTRKEIKLYQSLSVSLCN